MTCWWIWPVPTPVVESPSGTDVLHGVGKGPCRRGTRGQLRLCFPWRYSKCRHRSRVLAAIAAGIGQLTGDQLDSLLEQISVSEARLKAVQMWVLREVDRRQIPLGDGMRTLEDWIVGRLDVTRESDKKLTTVARTDSAVLADLLADGVSFDRVADELPEPPHGHRESRAPRRADALFVVCDRHDASDPGGTTAGQPGVTATVFIDATDGPTRPGAWIASGPKAGPCTLERILCGSPIDVIALAEAGS